MHDSIEPNIRAAEPIETFVEGRDFYFEDGLMVMTRRYLEMRRYCCGSGCRHCPFEGTPDHKRNISSSS